jgi:hypothetical protein
MFDLHQDVLEPATLPRERLRQIATRLDFAPDHGYDKAAFDRHVSSHSADNLLQHLGAIRIGPAHILEERSDLGLVLFQRSYHIGRHGL